MKKLLIIGLLIFAIQGNVIAQEKDPFIRTTLPIPEIPFDGFLGLTPSESTKDFPPMVVPPEGAPNVVIIMTDDVGFAASEVFGGPIPTPAMDRLTKNCINTNFVIVDAGMTVLIRPASYQAHHKVENLIQILI